MGITEKINALMSPREQREQREQRPRTQRSDVLALHDDFDNWLQRFFDDPWALHTLGAAGTPRTPNVDVRDTGDAVVVRAELPGLGKDDVDLTIGPQGLIIRGEKCEEKKDKNAFETRYASFVETVPLPPDVDPAQADARVEDGVLTVRFPKTGSAAGSRRIPIST
jgi:HSP20 family protein